MSSWAQWRSQRGLASLPTRKKNERTKKGNKERKKMKRCEWEGAASNAKIVGSVI